MSLPRRGQPVDGFFGWFQCALRFKPNRLGVAPDNATVNYPSVPPGGSGSVSIPLSCVAGQGNTDPLDKLVAALRDNTSGAVVFFDIPLKLEYFFHEGSPMDRNAFITAFRNIPPTSELSATVCSLYRHPNFRFCVLQVRE